jgi:rubrerythrin
MDEKKVFDLALKLETVGRDNYLKEADKTQNFVVHQIFLFLAGEELKHANYIKKIANDQGVKLDSKDYLVVVENMFTELLKHVKSENLSSAVHEEVYIAAENFEKESYDFYIGHSKQTTNPKVKELFLALAKQENAHYTLLEQLRVWAESPERWAEHTTDWRYEL